MPIRNCSFNPDTTADSYRPLSDRGMTLINTDGGSLEVKSHVSRFARIYFNATANQYHLDIKKTEIIYTSGAERRVLTFNRASKQWERTDGAVPTPVDHAQGYEITGDAREILTKIRQALEHGDPAAAPASGAAAPSLVGRCCPCHSHTAGASAPGPDTAALEEALRGLQAQIGRLGERLDRQEEGFRTAFGRIQTEHEEFIRSMDRRLETTEKANAERIQPLQEQLAAALKKLAEAQQAATSQADANRGDLQRLAEQYSSALAALRSELGASNAARLAAVDDLAQARVQFDHSAGELRGQLETESRAALEQNQKALADAEAQRTALAVAHQAAIDGLAQEKQRVASLAGRVHQLEAAASQAEHEQRQKALAEEAQRAAKAAAEAEARKVAEERSAAAAQEALRRQELERQRAVNSAPAAASSSPSLSIKQPKPAGASSPQNIMDEALNQLSSLFSGSNKVAGKERNMAFLNFALLKLLGAGITATELLKHSLPDLLARVEAKDSEAIKALKDTLGIQDLNELADDFKFIKEHIVERNRKEHESLKTNIEASREHKTRVGYNRFAQQTIGDFAHLFATIKRVSVKKFPYESSICLSAHLYSLKRRLKLVQNYYDDLPQHERETNAELEKTTHKFIEKTLVKIAELETQFDNFLARSELRRSPYG
jgi:hypothetical protein